MQNYILMERCKYGWMQRTLFIFGLYLLFNLTDNDSHMRFIFRNHIINHASLHLIPIYIP